MTLEEQYKEETNNLHIKEVHLMEQNVECYSENYVKWLEAKALSIGFVSVSDLIEVNHAYIEDADQVGSYDVTGRVDRLWITSKEFDSIKCIDN